jgi:hypothetical protein
LLANSRVEGSKVVDIATKELNEGSFYELVSFCIVYGTHFFQDFFSRTPILGMGLCNNWTQITHMSMYWHVMRQIPAFDCSKVFHIEMTLVFLGCFVAMTSSRSPSLYFQFSMTETILELVAMIFFIQLKEHQSKDHPFFMFCYLCCHLRYSDILSSLRHQFGYGAAFLYTLLF